MSFVRTSIPLSVCFDIPPFSLHRQHHHVNRFTLPEKLFDPPRLLRNFSRLSQSWLVRQKMRACSMLRPSMMRFNKRAKKLPSQRSEGLRESRDGRPIHKRRRE